ncbi:MULTISPECIES: hypothetical protein [Thermocrispum]|uniref:Uncharacterized protein n=1 Tax=Thermocrispum agreste TaxID=37925 RepID=A0A2W4J832_9PSEU|nr:MULTISPECIES: hypothetical protein [Thermocrispum]PZM94571.1 MAG: hypothetical protein DIU77_13960 [Thermocrispum agreste]
MDELLARIRLFRKTREKFERIIREEIDQPREMQALEVVAEAEDALRTAEVREEDARQRKDRRG